MIPFNGCSQKYRLGPSTHMSLHLIQRELEGITILTLRGRLVAGNEVSEFRSLIQTLVSEDRVRVILDLAETNRIDSSGLGVLIEAHNIVKSVGGALKLLNLTERNIQLLIITRLTTVFEIYNDEQSAINSFFPDREVKRFDILEFVRNSEKEKT
jgi:anti-sigma B factor antagonist